MKRGLFLVILATTLLTQNFAGFTPERPILNTFVRPTAWTLNKNEMYISILGNILYGISSQIEIGGNFWLFLAQMPNVLMKYSFAKEKTDKLAIAIQAHYWVFELKTKDGDKVSFSCINLTLPITNRLNEVWDFHFGGQYSQSLTETKIGELETSGAITTTSLFVGFDADLNEMTKFIIDAGYDIGQETPMLAFGIHLRWTTFNLKLGICYAPAAEVLQYYPLGDLFWRFGGET